MRLMNDDEETGSASPGPQQAASSRPQRQTVPRQYHPA